MKIKFFIIFICSFLQGCYVLSQATHFNNLYNQRKPISEVIKNPDTASELRMNLLYVIKTMEFAAEAGLNTDGAYEYFIDTGKRPVSYLTQAAYPLRLKFKTWWFPFVGEVPYLGFFNKEDRDLMAVELKGKGYDVSNGQVGAFSSMGWFEDPLFSSMLNRNKSQLAHLLFHELTHRTFWSRGSVKFNENLAEYVGMVLTVQFLRKEGMEKSLLDYQNRIADRKIYIEWLSKIRKDLKLLYKSAKSAKKQTVLERKSEIFKRFTGAEFPEFRSARYQRLRKKRWNNASILGASLYSPDIDRFEKAFYCFKNKVDRANIGHFLKALEIHEDESDTVFDALDRFCDEGAPSHTRIDENGG